MVSGEINVYELMERAEHIREWLKRQRRLIGYWALKDWRNAAEERDKVVIAERYGTLLDEELAQQVERYKRQHAYAKALGKARTPSERRAATKLLEV